MKSAAAAVGILLLAGVLFAADEAVVLMYHRFGDDRHPSTNIRVEQLEAQLDYLAEDGYTVVSLADVVAAIRGDGELPDRAVAITIDDAYRSVSTVGYPIFLKRGLPFTVFGRYRVNCTAPSADGTRFFWFSHPWFITTEEEFGP